MVGPTELPQPENYMTPGAQANARGAHDAHEWFYCQVCEVDVLPSDVEMHLRGPRHERSKVRRQHEAALFTLKARGVLPSWYEPRRGGLPYCKLCGKEATDAHLISPKHVNAENWERCASATTNISGNGYQTLQEITMPCPTRPTVAGPVVITAGIDEPPKIWGDPRLFEYDAGAMRFKCRLCSQNGKIK